MFDQNTKGKAALSCALTALAQGIDVKQLYSTFEASFSEIIASGNYEMLLSTYNRKTLANQASGALGLKNGELPELILRLARDDCRDEIRFALKKYFGNFGTHVA
jgi:hypothetical protein